MLVITRNQGEQLHIGPDIAVTVLDIGKSRVTVDVMDYTGSQATVSMVKGDKHHIRDGITIHLLRVSRSTIRIGGDAPRHIAITRPDMKKRIAQGE